MEIRPARAEDHAAIRDVVLAAFGQELEAELVEALRRSHDVVIELVAEHDHCVIGQILVSALVYPENCVALAPVSVLPTHQRQGVGSALIEDAIRRAREGGWAAMFVLGEPAYYTRFGFSTDSCERFDSRYPKAYMMALELVEDGLAGVSEKIVYAKPFEELES